MVVLSDGTVAEEGSPKDLEEKNGVYAVSYTHLDVYKRQVLCWYHRTIK